MIEITVTTRSAASAERVFALLADAATWVDWAPLDEARVASGSGIGEVRSLRSEDVTTRERVVYVEAPNCFAYEVLEGLPFADHASEITLEPAPEGGTVIDWRYRFTPAVRGTGRLLRRRLESFVTEAATGLAHAAAAATPHERPERSGSELTPLFRRSRFA